MAYSPNKVKIDLSSLVHNLKQVKKLVSSGTRIMGIVKSDAYGHGLIPVSRVLEKNGIDFLGVCYMHEALELRKDGVRSPIVILCGIQTREDAREVINKDLIPVLYDLDMARILNEEGKRERKRANVHIKVDTGMGRLGVASMDLAPFIKMVMACKALYPVALMSHLSAADDPRGEFTETQIGHFKRAIEIGHAMGLALPLNSLANSAGIMAHRDSHFNLVRPGIMLYGGLPSREFQSPIPLKPVMNFKGHILQIRDHPDNTPIGYSRTYYTRGPKKIAVLSAGYGDGLPRSMSNRGKVLIEDKKVSIVGNISMNMTMADITGLEDVRPGREAVFLGTQGCESITGEHLATWGKTISYEVFCSIGQRNTKEYHQ